MENRDFERFKKVSHMHRPLILAFLLLVTCPAMSQSADIPKNYTDCIARSGIAISPAECRYTAVDKDKANDERSKEYIACAIFQSGYRFLGGYDCKWAENGNNKNYPKKIECDKSGSSPVSLYPEGACHLTFFDSGYKFPKTYDECQRDPHHGLMIPEAESAKGYACAISISGARPEWYNMHDAETVLQKCLDAGGTVISHLPACDVYYPKP